MGGTAREQILAAVEHITRRGDGTFTAQEVIEELHARDTNLADSTIETHIRSRMCADAPDNHGTTYDDLERVERGRYRLKGRT